MNNDRPSLTGVKKRQQISSANKTMFMWIVIGSVVLAICIVFSQFLFRQFLFNNKVIAAKIQTNGTLEKNIKEFDTLKTEVNKLIGESKLSSLKVADSDTSLQVIIDALPTEDDRAALGTSLQQVVLARSGAVIDSLSVVGTTTSTSLSVDSSSPQAIGFDVALVGSYDQIKRTLEDVQHSIRPFDIDTLQLQGEGDKLKATIKMKTYFLSPKSTMLTKESIKP